MEKLWAFPGLSTAGRYNRSESLSLRCVGAAQREQRDFTREQFVSLHPQVHASSSVWAIYIPRPNPSPTLCRHGEADARPWSRKPAAVSITSWLSRPPLAASPFPPLLHPVEKGPLPWPWVPTRMSVCRSLCFFVGDGYQRPAWFPGGVACTPRGALLASGLRGLTLLAAGGPVYSPEHSKSVSPSGRLHLFLHLLQLLVWQRSPEAEF